ncbi:MAG: hypothetical protein FJ403_00880 [Verrucomicrobia bacterium]|nr:hypothetical protein [Verrucomicrobiota bacterium]
MRKKSKLPSPIQAQLRPVEPAPAESPALAAVVEYRPVNESGLWRVEQWELFAGEFSLVRKEDLPVFHEMLSRSPRAWMIVRRLFGFRPLRLPLNGNPDDYRTWSRFELCDNMGIAEKELAAELEALRTFWQQHLSPKQPDTPPPPPSAPNGQMTLVETDDEVLKKYGFNSSVFDLPHRSPEDNKVEKQWFAIRVREWRKLFDQSMTARLATQALFNEMRLRREENALWDLDKQPVPESLEKRNLLEKNKAAIENRITELEQSYQEQLKNIEDIAPWFNATGKQISITGAIGELIKGVQEYKAKKDTRILDGVFTALELQVLMQQSRQVPEPMYRFGWVTYINSTKAFLWDQSFESASRPADLAKLDAGFKAGVQRFTEERGDVLPDLERDGPEGEYEELYSREEKTKTQGPQPGPRDRSETVLPQASVETGDGI